MQRAAEIAAVTATNEPVLKILNAGLVADIRTYKNPADTELWLDGLRKAGLEV